MVLFFKKEHSSCLRSRPIVGKFSALDTAAKLNAITDVPYRTMAHDSDRPGEHGLLMGKGLADSRRTPG